ncbi:11426_t:CDS:2, partial [Acaulospora colombiana]
MSITLVYFLISKTMSIAFAEDFGDKQDEHLLYKVCLEKLRLKPQLFKSRDGELVQQLVSCCMKSFE